VAESDEKQNIPCGRVESHQNYRSSLDEHTHRFYQHPGGLLRRLSGKIISYKPDNNQFISKASDVLLNVIDQHIYLTNAQHRKAKVLVKQYYETGRVDSLIRLYTLETPFCYAKVRAWDQRIPVLIVFEFSSKCFTAIQLEKLSNQLPSISEIESEREVLILPRTTFRVQKVEQYASQAAIYLTFYPRDKEIDEYFTLLAHNISEY
ncbi:unnamed protein product, partial [Rotaria magnacalcarata]